MDKASVERNQQGNSGGPARRRQSAAIPAEALGFLWGDNEQAVEIVAALAPRHPRAFWSHAKAMAGDPGKHIAVALGQALGDERLLRLCLRELCAPSHQARHGVARHVQAARRLLVNAVLFFPGKGAPWRLARLGALKKGLDSACSSEVFGLIGLAARSGCYESALALARSFPDGRLGEAQQRRLKTGDISYAGQGFGDPEGRATARARVEAEKTGVGAAKAQARGQGPANALFWIVERAAALRAEDKDGARKWARLGAELIERGLNVADSSASLGHAMGDPELFEALRAARPILGNPGFYCFHRPEALMESFRLAPDAQSVARICAYDETSSSARASTSVSVNHGPMKTAGPVPSSAFALLAGHAPDPSWEDVGADRWFKMPAKLLEAAMAGTLSASDLAGVHFETGKNMSVATLAKALGRPLHAEAKTLRQGPRENKKKNAL